MTVPTGRRTRDSSFYVHFFYVAQKMLPRHQLRELCRLAKKERDKMLADNEALKAEELTLLLRPLVDELLAKYPLEKANEFVKEAARRAGLDPSGWGVHVLEEPQS